MTDITVDACCLINLCAAGRILVPGPPPPAHSARRRRIQLPGRPWPAPSARREDQASTPVEGIEPLGLTLHVPENVRREALRLYQPDDDDPTKLVSVPLDLESLIRHGLIRACQLEGDVEEARFVQFARELDDGESACLAIAVERHWMLGTDDRIATRLALSLGVTVSTTEQLVKRWCDRSGASARDVTEVLLAIETFGHYVPRRTSPLRDWWWDHTKRS